MPGPAPSRTALEIRSTIVDGADLRAAGDFARDVGNDVLDRLNVPDLDNCTRLLAASLTARAIIQATAEWLGSCTDPIVPLPDAYAALVDLLVDLPVQFEPVIEPRSPQD